MEYLETIGAQKPDEDEIKIHLLTVQDEFKAHQQIEYFDKIQESCGPIGIKFTWEFDKTNSIHARHIVTDNGWKILLDRGLDIFQHYEMNDAFAITNRIQRYRACKAFEATFIKI
jgi:ATP-dependent Lon protease